MARLDIEQNRQYYRDYYAKHKDGDNAQKRYYAKNKDTKKYKDRKKNWARNKYWANYEVEKEKQKIYKRKQSAEHPEIKLFEDAKTRAKKASIAFNIVREDIIIPELCPILGMKLERGTGKVHGASPSLDKIIPSLGYIKGNIQVISFLANVMKNKATPEQLLKFASWINSFYKEPIQNGA